MKWSESKVGYFLYLFGSLFAPSIPSAVTYFGYSRRYSPVISLECYFFDFLSSSTFHVFHPTFLADKPLQEVILTQCFLSWKCFQKLLITKKEELFR